MLSDKQEQILLRLFQTVVAIGVLLGIMVIVFFITVMIILLA